MSFRSLILIAIIGPCLSLGCVRGRHKYVEQENCGAREWLSSPQATSPRADQAFFILRFAGTKGAAVVELRQRISSGEKNRVNVTVDCEVSSDPPQKSSEFSPAVCTSFSDFAKEKKFWTMSSLHARDETLREFGKEHGARLFALTYGESACVSEGHTFPDRLSDL